MKYLVLFAIVISITLFIKTQNTTYDQGVWNIITYQAANGVVGKNTSRIKVTRSESIILNDRIRLLVYFKVENTADYPNSFGWKNKFIETYDGIAFLPTRGVGVNNLQPYTESNELYTEYRLPTYVDVKKIYWGLYDNPSHSMRYKILLQPTEKAINLASEPKIITYDTLLEKSKNLIGLKVKLLCKGSQFMQVNQKGNTFQAACQDIDNPYFATVSYYIGFKFTNELLPLIYKIKKQSLKFNVTGVVEWPESTDYMSKVIIDVKLIEIDK